MDTKKQSARSARRRRKTPVKPLFADASNGRKIDLNAEFGWLDAAMTSRRKLFCYYYAARQCEKGHCTAADAARLAGFSARTSELAASAAGRLLEKSEIRAEIESLSRQIAKKIAKTGLEEEFSRIIGAKIRRARFDATSLYETEEIDAEGGSVTVARIKPIEELTEEQREAVIGVEFSRGTPNYKVQSKADAENELVEIYAKFFAPPKDAGGYDFEATAEVVDKGVKLKARARKKQGDGASCGAVFSRAASPSYED